MALPIEVRFWSKVDPSAGESGCWRWRGALQANGYGHFRDGSDRSSPVVNAHTVAFRLVRGPVPAGLQLDHLCRNRGCVNPWHLEPVTSRENTLRGDSPSARFARATTCRRGHPFDVFRPLPSGRIGRRCSTCDRSMRLRLREERAA